MNIFCIYNECPIEFDTPGPIEFFLVRSNAIKRMKELKGEDAYSHQYYEIVRYRLEDIKKFELSLLEQ